MLDQGSAPFGLVLFHYRAAAGLTQEALAERARLRPGTIAALEHSRRRVPRSTTVALLADALLLDEHDRNQFMRAARAISAGAATEDSQLAAAIAPTARGTARVSRLRRCWLRAEETPIVDRVHELDTIQRLLTKEDVRLLTLVGPAGVGKTRLAIAAAARFAEDSEHFPDGVDVVDLSSVRDPELVLESLANAIGLLDFGGRPMLERLMAALEGRRLLMLDNFEQVLPADASLAALLGACPELALLVTSRVPLRLHAAQTLHLAPLPVPAPTAPLPPLEEFEAIPSVALFVQRARRHRADFVLAAEQAPVVARLTAELDGLPLALELAAARTTTLPLPVLANRLGDRLHLLRWDAADLPARQRSLEAAIGWSYDLLDKEEQRLFRCLGVFAGRVSIDTITDVVGKVGDAAEDTKGGYARHTLDRLVELAEQSLLVPVRTTDADWQQEGSEDVADEADDEVQPAFGMLQTVREYAEEQLAASYELEAAQRAHAHVFLALAERATSQLLGQAQRAWFLRLEREHDNLRAALRWLLDQDEPAERERALRLAGALGPFWVWYGHHAEGSRWLEEALDRSTAGSRGGARPRGGAPSPLPLEVRAESEVTADAARERALRWAGALLGLSGDFAGARARLQEALNLARQRQDLSGVVEALAYLGLCAVYAGEAATAVPLLEEALQEARELGEPFPQSLALYITGVAAHAQGHTNDAEVHYTKALERFTAMGHTLFAGAAHIYLAAVTADRDDLSASVGHVRAALMASAHLHNGWLLSYCARAAGLGAYPSSPNPAERARLLGAADALRQVTDAQLVLWMPFDEDQMRKTLGARLTEEEWEAAYRAGRLLSPGEVIRIVLRVLDEVAPDASRSLSYGPTPGAGSSTNSPTGTVPTTSPPPAVPGAHNALSAREREVLRLVAQGLGNKAIARQLVISANTVNYHLNQIFNKLGVDTRAQAVALALRQGLL